MGARLLRFLSWQSMILMLGDGSDILGAVVVLGGGYGVWP
jgi:hypothetical protein